MQNFMQSFQKKSPEVSVFVGIAWGASKFHSLENDLMAVQGKKCGDVNMDLQVCSTD